MRSIPRLIALAIAVELGFAVAAAVAVDTRAGEGPTRLAVKPNIVLILTDDQTVESLSKMPYTRSLPGVRFTNAFVNTPLCCPSRATILTGQYSHHTGVGNNFSGTKLNEPATVATWLKSGGYRTGLFGKYLNGYPFARGPYTPPGWDQWAAYANGQSYYDYTLYENGIARDYGSTPADYSTDVFKQKALDFIRTNPAGQPFFLYFAPVGPHHPYVPAPRHVDAYKTAPVPRPPNANEADVSDKPAWTRALPSLDAAALARLASQRRKAWETLLSVDEAVKAIVQASPDNTMIVFTSDNGLSFGEHRWVGKHAVYDENIRVPLVITYPGAATRTESGLVSNVDLAPTFAQAAGVAPTIPVDGRSLLPLITNTPTSWRTSLLVEFAGPGVPNNVPVTPYWAVRTKDHLYAELDTGEKELYVMAKDPYQLTNVANQPSYRSIQSSLASQLARLKG